MRTKKENSSTLTNFASDSLTKQQALKVKGGGDGIIIEDLIV